MSKEYKKCCNPDCERLCKRHIRCGYCIRNSIYVCQDCKTDIFSPCAKLCNDCFIKRHKKFQREYQTIYRAKKKSVTDQRLLVSIPQ